MGSVDDIIMELVILHFLVLSQFNIPITDNGHPMICLSSKQQDVFCKFIT